MKKNKKMDTRSWEEIKDKVYGEIGGTRRDQLERETAPIKIGILLRKAREEKKLTQAQLAEIVQKKRPYISRVENDGLQPVVTIVLETQDQQARRTGNRHFHFLRDMPE